MDTATINTRGYEPVKPMLARIDAIKDLPSLMKFVADEINDNGSIVSLALARQQTAAQYCARHTGGIGLPERDYYFKTNASTLAIQKRTRNTLPHFLN